MAKTVTISRFDGGIAEDTRTTSVGENISSVNFDLNIKTNRIVPIVDSEAEALTSGDITDKRIADIGIDNNGAFYAIGKNSAASTAINIYSKDSTSDISSTYTAGSTLSAGSTFMKNMHQNYLNFAYIVTEDSHIRYFNGSWNDLGSMSVTTWANMGQPRPLRHPADDLLYVGLGNKVFRTNSAGTSASLYFTFPVNFLNTSLTNYGSDLACSLSPRFGGNSYVAILDRISTNTSARDLINWGEGSLAVLENIGGVLIGISTTEILFSPTTTYSSSKTKKIIVKGYSGGSVETIKEITVPSTVTLKQYKWVKNNKLYFGCDGDDALYCVYKNKNGRWVVTKEHYIANGTTVTNLNGFGFLGDYLFTMYDTSLASGLFYRTKTTNSYANTSIYETTKNPNMDVSDRTKLKKLKSISASKDSSTGTITVKYSVDGGSYNNIFTLSDGGKSIIKGINESTGIPFSDGYDFSFKIESTLGAQPVELKYSYETIEELI